MDTFEEPRDSTDITIALLPATKEKGLTEVPARGRISSRDFPERRDRTHTELPAAARASAPPSLL
jgi:hypothetical protein